MSEEHTDNLKKARAKLIEQRRAFVKVLAGPYERGKTEQAREKFLEMQTAIEAMNRAIEDEERSQGSAMGFLYIGGTSRSLRFTSRTAACIRCLFNEHRGFSHEGRATWQASRLRISKKANVSRSPASRSLQSV